MPLGPIEVLVLGFPGNKFTGGILPEIERLVTNETIAVIDGLLVRKDADGTVTLTEFEDVQADGDIAHLATLMRQVDSLVSDEDVDQLAAGLEPNSSAAVLVFEHTWAKPLRDEVVGSGGVLMANFRVPGRAVDELLAELAAMDG